MNLTHYIIKRLNRLKNEIIDDVPIVKGIKLAGSSAEGYFFILQFKDIYISSDYDIVILLERYPYIEEVSKIMEILRKPLYRDLIERFLIDNLDVRFITLEYPYKGRGVRVPSIYDGNPKILKYLISGITIYGENYFKKLISEVLDSKNQEISKYIAYEILSKREFFKLLAELNAYDRVANLLGFKDVVSRIRLLISRYRDYHRLNSKDLGELRMECEKVRESVYKRLRAIS